MVLMVFSCDTAKKAKSSKKAGATPTAAAPKKKPGKNDIKPYSKVITKDAKTDKGLFDVHKIDEKYFYEIPDSLFCTI